MFWSDTCIQFRLSKTATFFSNQKKVTPLNFFKAVSTQSQSVFLYHYKS